MNAVEILSHCRNSGIALAVDAEGKLHASGNKDGIATLREDIKVHKAELVTILQAPLTLDLTREDHRQEALAAVERGESVLVVSATLGEPVYWAPDEEAVERIKRAPDYGGEVCYTLDEITKFRGQSAEMLRAVHEFKRELGANLERAEKDCYPSQAGGPVVRCGNCQHFERMDHPHTGRCAAGNGRHWLWDTDRRLCKDFLSQAEGDSEQDKAGVIEDLKDRLTESERRFEAREQALKIAGAELGEARERIEFLDQVNVKLMEYSRELRMQGLELEDSLAMEKAYNRLWALQIHNPVSELSEPDFKLLIQLCHPDKHNGSAASERATQLLLGMRRTQ
jgi:hypothetical protein